MGLIALSVSQENVEMLIHFAFYYEVKQLVFDIFSHPGKRELTDDVSIIAVGDEIKEGKLRSHTNV